MDSEKEVAEDRGQLAEPDGSGSSFHDRLLRRSATSLPDYRKARPLFRLAPRTAWLTAFGQIVGHGGIFAGGLAIGGGAMLLRQGELLKERPGMMIAAGLVFVALAILSKLLAREWSKSRASAAGG